MKFSIFSQGTFRRIGRNICLYSILLVACILSFLIIVVLYSWPIHVAIALFVYSLVLIGVSHISDKIGRWVIRAKRGLYFFNTIALLCFRLIVPVFLILSAIILVSFFSFILPGYIIRNVYKSASTETLVFIVLSFGTIVSGYAMRYMYSFMLSCTTIRFLSDKESVNIIFDFVRYVVNERNIRLLIQVLYFLFLIVSGVKSIQYGQPVLSLSLDNSIVKAFLVYISFGTMLSKSNDVDFDSQQLYTKTISLITSKMWK